MVAEAPLLEVMATAGASAILYVGLIDELGAELTGGGYARQATTASATGAVIRLNTDETFLVAGGTTVAGWKGYSALTAGTSYGGGALTPETYAGDGEYTLVAASTGYTVAAEA